MPEPEPESYEERAARLPQDWSEQQKVEALLYSYCGECHGADLVGRPEFYECTHCFIDDIDLLIEERLIVPGNPEESRVYQSMVDGRMPPGGYPGAPPELIERVGAFIASLCPRDDRECQAGTDAAD